MSELEEAEAAIAALEQQARDEWQQLDGVARELEGRLKRARAMVAQAQGVGSMAPELAFRVQAIEVPRLSVETVNAKATAARRAAIEARSEAVSLLKAQMVQHQNQLKRLVKQLHEDELAAERHLDSARAVATRVAEAARQLDPPVLSEPPVMPLPATISAANISRVRREQARVRMQVKIDFGSDNNFYSGFSTNLSDGGVFIATVKLQPIGTPMDLYFRLPSGEGVETQGVVRWVREVDDRQPDVLPGLGVQFVGLKDDARDAINHFVKSREPMFYPD